MKSVRAGTVLGIDMGPNSIGWSLLNTDGGRPAGILASGVRIFEAGLDDLELDGKGKSRNLKRREARSARRLLDRRSRRVAKLARILQRVGLLPEGDMSDGERRHTLLEGLDKTLGSPYILRKRALDEELTLHEIGRAIFHLGQRRGFLSNRKAKVKDDEEEGKVKEGISELGRKITEAGARTLGEYFSMVNSKDERIRGLYTSRGMYQHEFNVIWEAQKGFHPARLSDDLKEQVFHAIFDQRPLKNQKNLIGDCELEPGRKRAPWAVLAAQRFRYLQALNNIEVIVGDTGEVRGLTPEERTMLVSDLETKGDLKFNAMRKLLKLPKGSTFNLERGGEERVPGNRTAAKLSKVFGERWRGFSETEQDAVVEDLRSIVKEDALKGRAMRTWGLDDEAAVKLSKVTLEDGYCSFSRQAIEKLMPRLTEGVHLQTAVREVYPGRWDRGAKPKDDLPSVRCEDFQELRNPVVERTLTELRRVVNSIIREYGKPGTVRIELARDLKQPPKKREATHKKMRGNEKDRKKAAEKIFAETGITMPRRDDILKVQLAEECGYTCPYTGRGISIPALVGDHPQFDIEHIIPFSRSLDNSYLNKTLCYSDENRGVKGGKTPHEAYSGSGKWGDMLARVKCFKGDCRDKKLRRFMMDEDEVAGLLEDFSSRQLNDTRYATRRAKEYLGMLYGGVDADGIDADRKRRVTATSGQVTAYLRNVWDLNSILSDGPTKSRDDHRHHAVDALTIALADEGIVKMLSDAASRATQDKRRMFGRVSQPWDGFLEEARKSVKDIVVSRRVSRRVRGALHEETFYGKLRTDDKGKGYIHIRKPLTGLSAKDMDNIVDPVVRDVVLAKLDELGGNAKKFEDANNLPCREYGEGQKILIKKVRIRKNLSTFAVGSGYRTRNVQTESNHHMEVLEVLDGRGNVKWEGVVVNILEAHRRLKDNEPIIRREHGEGKKFLFSLAGGEVIYIDDSKKQGLYEVRSIWEEKGGSRLRLQTISDARKQDTIKKSGDLFQPMLNTLRGKCHKVFINPLGEVRNAND